MGPEMGEPGMIDQAGPNVKSILPYPRPDQGENA